MCHAAIVVTQKNVILTVFLLYLNIFLLKIKKQSQVQLAGLTGTPNKYFYKLQLTHTRQKTIPAICICSPNVFHSRGFHQWREIESVCSIRINRTATKISLYHKGNSKTDNTYSHQRPISPNRSKLIWPTGR